MVSGWEALRLGVVRRLLAERAVGERSKMPPGAACGEGSVFDRRDAAEVAVFEAVAVAFEAEHLGVVHEPVDHRGGGYLIAEDFAPRTEWLVGGDDQAGAFVTAADEHEHRFAAWGSNGM